MYGSASSQSQTPLIQALPRLHPRRKSKQHVTATAYYNCTPVMPNKGVIQKIICVLHSAVLIKENQRYKLWSRELQLNKNGSSISTASIHIDNGTGLEVIEHWLRIPGPYESQKCHYIHGRSNSKVEARKSMRVRSRRRKTSQDCA